MPMSESIERLLGRIEAKVDIVLTQQQQHHERMNGQGERLSKVERWQARIVGAVAVVAFMAGIAVKLLS